MKLTFLGTGTAWSKAPHNYNNNAIVQAAPDAPRFLLDCGGTAPQSLFDLGLGVDDFGAVLITHIHGDHVFGLEEVGFYNFFKLGRKVKLYLPERLLSSRSGIEGEDLWDNCLRGSMGTVLNASGGPREVGLEDYFDVTYLRVGEPVEIHGVEVEIFEVDHVPMKPCYGVLLDNTVAYTSDTTYSRKRVDWMLSRGCQHIFHDAYFGITYPGRVHASFDELLDLPPDLYTQIDIMHYNDNATEDQRKRATDLGFNLAKKHQSFDF